MTRNSSSHVLLTGATGFVGRHVLPELEAAGHEVRCASRDAERAAERDPRRSWVELDIERVSTIDAALSGCDSAIYLINSMGQGGDLEHRERRAAARFALAAAAAGLSKIVYLGGMAPQGLPSKHLRSRLATGDVLRGGTVPTIELRAGMIVGVGSESWNIVRDLAVRLPVMVLPRWLSNISEPVAIGDVAAAIVHALEQSNGGSHCYDLPGPERLSSRDILMRIAGLNGTRPLAWEVPVLTPSLSSHWIRLVTRANFDVARQMVEGSAHDLIATGPVYWDQMDGYPLVSFDEAAGRALEHERGRISQSVLSVEERLRQIAPRVRP